MCSTHTGNWIWLPDSQCRLWQYLLVKVKTWCSQSMGIIGKGGEESWQFLHQQGSLKCMFCLGEWGRPCDQRLEGNAWSINLRGHDLQKTHDVQHHIPLDVQFLIWEWRWWPSVCEAESSNGERSRLAQSFEYNYDDFIPILHPFLKGISRSVRRSRTHNWLSSKITSPRSASNL